MTDTALTDDDEEPTPAAIDPCTFCGHSLVRLSDNYFDVPPPLSLSHAVQSWKHCVATQRSRWAFCPRAIKGFVSVPIEGSEDLRVPLERRAALR